MPADYRDDMPDSSDNCDAADTFDHPVAQANHDELVRSLRQLADEFPDLQSASDATIDVDVDVELGSERDSFDHPPAVARHDDLLRALRDLEKELERDIEANQQP